MVKKLLIANRGEIAIRIARTAAEMGIATVAVYPQDDARSLHVKHADEAYELPGRGVSAYLDIGSLLDAGRGAGCDAVHPGYGFLSERSDFVLACQNEGLVFVGPDPETIRLQGDKVAARNVATTAGVPVIEGTDKIPTADDVRAFYRSMGKSPIIIKAVNGGGGRGMRIIREESEIDSAFSQCKAEARAAFGDDALYVERYLPSVRHIEVQIVGDGKNVVHLWERDCSVQRRNQKIIELAPAPNLEGALRDNLLAAAIAIGRACRYRSLGTVEFLVSADGRGDSGYYFIETNPRIQVEHTITEEITGIDLIALQLCIASGASLHELGLIQKNMMGNVQTQIGPPNGYAVQLRVNTESFGPDGQLIPSSGRITAYQPPGGRGVRVDSSGYQGYGTNPNFDSLLAKVIVHIGSEDIDVLMAKAERALSEFRIEGIRTNIEFLRALLALPVLRSWDVSVRSIQSQIEKLSVSSGGAARHRYFEETVLPEAENRTELEDFPEGSVPVTSPLQAVLTSMEVGEGQAFEAGADLAVIEVMKMQHVIRASAAGRVLTHLVRPGDTVNTHQPILLIEEHSEADVLADERITVDPDHVRPDLRALQERIALTLDEARPQAVRRRRSRGQRTARENIADLCDEGSFQEYGQLVFAAQRSRYDPDEIMRAAPADGIITGIGAINGRYFADTDNRAAVLAYDATVMAGTQGVLGHKKTDRILELAHDRRLPVVFFTEGGGGRPNDVDFAHTAHSFLNIKTFHLFAKLRSKCPRIAVNSGYCFAGNAALMGSCDIRVATRNSWIGLGGPAMIEAGGLGAYDPKEIGPAPMHAETGLVDLLADDDAHATALAREVLACFQGALKDWDADDQRLLRHLVPENRKRVYDMRHIITTLADRDSFLELRPFFAHGMITGFIRIEGRPLGIIANNPMHLGGAIDAGAAEKGAGFLDLCGRFRLPVISLCDTPGFMVGPESEREGCVQKACAFLEAGANLNTTLIFVCLRKGYGIGAQAMAGGSFAAPICALSWPSGEFGPMGLEGAVELGYRRELEAEPDPIARQTLFERLVQKSYQQASAFNVASLQEIDAVIDPKDTREWIAKGLKITAVS